MNLYIFNETRLGAVYGVGTYIRELTTALKNTDINVCVINLTSEKPQIQIQQTDGIKQWDFPLPVQWTKSDEEQWDLYHCNIVYLLKLHIKDKKNLIFHLNYNQKSRLAEELKNNFDCRIVLTIHYFDWCFKLFGNLTHFRQLLETQHTAQVNEDEKTIKEIIQKEKELFKKVDHIFCLSEKTRQILQDDYSIHPKKMTVIYNGLSTMDNGQLTIDNEGRIDRIALRRKWHISDQEFIILFAGRLDSIKGLSYALQAFKIVLNSHPHCHFVIAGNGVLDVYMTACEDIWMNVTWTGFIKKEKLYELYTIADLGIIPSFHEQCSYVAIEMMMHGLPIIGSTSTGLCEMVENHVTGLHIPVIEHTDRAEIDSLHLAEKMIYLINNQEERLKMGQNGWKRYLENYSPKIFRRNLLKAYKSVCQYNDIGKIKTLIVTGQHIHQWEVSHVAIKQILENSGLFAVDVAISPKTGGNMLKYKPDFASYQLIMLDYCGDRWSAETEKSFLDYVGKGGGVVIYHAANNAFRHWKEFNQITGFGGWENRNEADGPYIYLKDGQLVYDNSPGCGGSHGYRHEFVLHCGNPDHPVTKGLPVAWLHAQDELYDRMRGPGIVKDILFWAYSDPETRGSGRDELAIFTVDYGKARIFHTTLGHTGDSLDNNMGMQCAGFQVTLLRGAEWAATGQVAQPVPDDFPTATTISLREKYK